MDGANLLDRLRSSDSLSSIKGSRSLSSISDDDKTSSEDDSMATLIKQNVHSTFPTTKRTLFDVVDADEEGGEEREVKKESRDTDGTGTLPRKLQVENQTTHSPDLIRIVSVDGPLPPEDSLKSKGLLSVASSPFKEGPSPLKDLDTLLSAMGWKPSDFEPPPKPIVPPEGKESDTQSDEYHRERTERLERELENDLARFEQLVPKKSQRTDERTAIISKSKYGTLRKGMFEALKQSPSK